MLRGAPRCGQTSSMHRIFPSVPRNRTTFIPRISTPFGLEPTSSEIPVPNLCKPEHLMLLLENPLPKEASLLKRNTATNKSSSSLQYKMITTGEALYVLQRDNAQSDSISSTEGATCAVLRLRASLERWLTDSIPKVLQVRLASCQLFLSMFNP